MRIIVVTGLSGSGKSTAIRAFEDRGFFCVDNLPSTLIPTLVDSLSNSGQELDAVVLGIDSRERTFLDGFDAATRQMSEAGHQVEVIYLDTNDQALIRRFSETRRKHPLGNISIVDALESEKRLLEPLRIAATRMIDTSALTVHELKRQIQGYIDQAHSSETLNVILLSFGYKYGVPLEADLMFDARFLPNPYFVAELKRKTGNDQEVFDYVTSCEHTQVLLNHIEGLLGFSIPLFDYEGKSYLTIAIGCTGGKHRSVSLVRALEKFLQTKMPEYHVAVRHRDIEK